MFTDRCAGTFAIRAKFWPLARTAVKCFSTVVFNFATSHIGSGAGGFLKGENRKSSHGQLQWT
jgi:hypothetical protein